MNEASKTLNTLTLKLVSGSLLTTFSSFEVELSILCVLIVIDTITGSAYAVKIRKFSSTGLRRGLKKIFFYSLCVLVVRLLEVGISSIISTTMLTSLITGFLIIVEALSTLENLTLLGVPLPSRISDFIIKQINSTAMRNLLISGLKKQEYIDEINDMVDFNLPNIKDENYKRLLEIKFSEWAHLVNYFDIQFDNVFSDNNDILFFRISSLINATITKINDRWIIEEIPEDHIQSFSEWHNPRIGKWIDSIKAICFSTVDMDKKKEQIIEKLVIALYQTLIDIRKAEFFKNNSGAV